MTSINTSPRRLSAPCAFKLIYVYRINDTPSHKGLLKIGDTTLKDVPASKTHKEFPPNCAALKSAAKIRIREQTETAGLFPDTEILHTEIAVDHCGNAFRDHNVHRVLKNAGIYPKHISSAREWFPVDLETAKSAIDAVKTGKHFITRNNISSGKNPIEFRPEQKKAIEQTVKKFKSGGKNFLWNAKMRFGKTLSALQVVKEMKFLRTIIVTHRPAVSEGWFEDFDKIFFERNNKYHVGGRGHASFEDLNAEFKRNQSPYVYFASIQDLRGSEAVAGVSGFDKNQDVFKTPWDCIIIDEAHEGTQTDLGAKMLDALKKEKTVSLALSGTPFNVAQKYKDDETFVWDYISEQQEKLAWEREHPGEANPYAALPKLNIHTYSLCDIFKSNAFVEVEDKSFNFSEFFRTDSQGAFVHKNDVEKFLDLLVGKSRKTQTYPFANDEYRDFFRHSFWILPGVSEAAALETLLKSHDVFGAFTIINVAGNTEASASQGALNSVKTAIKENDYTITLSCGRLTTGVTVPEWTAVLYLAGTYKTTPASYLQTIFRVQSPGSVNGRAKEECYAFDFAPDRVITIVEQVAQYSAGTNKKAAEREKKVRDFIHGFINFAPVISYSGSEMTPISTEDVLREIKKLCINQVVRSGFSSPRLYNNKVWNLGASEMALFKNLEGIVGRSAGNADKPKEVIINETGLLGENLVSENTADDDQPTTPVRKTSEEEKTRRKNRDIAISILTNAAVRVPLLVFGADGDVATRFDAETFPDNFDDASWEEFMGKLSKEDFKKLVAPYLESTVFTHACSRIRERVVAADNLPVPERIRKIVEIHSEFKNPDKETVLTPWRVVNMHLSDTLGGYDFFCENHEDEVPINPRFLNYDSVTQKTLGNANAKILELNSKTGLYPLYVAYSLMRAKFEARLPRRNEPAEKRFSDAWFEALSENIFIVCKTKMARAITRRTLVGFRTNAKTNIIVEEQLLPKLKNERTFPLIVQKIQNPKTWKILNTLTPMKFNAIVGNPPYQADLGGASALPVYQYFVSLAKALTPNYISMIMPARWFNTGTGLDEFREDMLRDERITVLHDFISAKMLFPTVEIKGGIIYLLWDRNHQGECRITTHYDQANKIESTRKLLDDELGVFVRDGRMISILKKIANKETTSFCTIVSSRDPFGYDIRLPNSYKVAKHKFNLTNSGNDIRFYYNGWRKSGVGYVPKESVGNNVEWVGKFKILIPKAWGTGNSETDWLNPFIVKPNSVCTETYLVVGPFENKDFAQNALSYMQTKFFHALVAVLKISQNAARSVYELVPMQDFSKPWTDEELYKKYRLSAKEIEFIESMIRPMS